MFSKSLKIINLSLIFTIIIASLNSCGIYRKTDAREYPPEPGKRIKKNIEEGRGFRIMGGKKSGDFDFATSNEMWRAALDTIDFIPLLTVDYGGGIIITDWYNNSEKENQSIKISIRFLSNEIRADAIKIQIFKKKCSINANCKINQSSSSLNGELKIAILKKAARYKKTEIKEYKGNATVFKSEEGTGEGWGKKKK